LQSFVEDWIKSSWGRFLDNFPLVSLHSWENHHFGTKTVNFLPSMAPIFVKRFFGKEKPHEISCKIFSEGFLGNYLALRV
jgi:hypothetical protein